MSAHQILLVGVGGQGVITASTLLGRAADAAGLPTVLGQLHGMSQRGGSVECSVVLGRAQSSFIVGPPNVLLAFEPLEALRAKSRIGSNTHVIMSTSVVLPPPVLAGAATYPDIERIADEVRSVAGTLTVIDGPALTAQAGESRTLNVLMLGALAGLARGDGEGRLRSEGSEGEAEAVKLAGAAGSPAESLCARGEQCLLPFDVAHLRSVIRQRLGERFLEENMRAFDLGMSSTTSITSATSAAPTSQENS